MTFLVLINLLFGQHIENEDFLSQFKKKDRLVIEFLQEATELHMRSIGVAGVKTKQYSFQKKLSKNKGPCFFVKLLTSKNSTIRLLAILELIRIDDPVFLIHLEQVKKSNEVYSSFIGGSIFIFHLDEIFKEQKKHPIYKEYFQEGFGKK